MENGLCKSGSRLIVSLLLVLLLSTVCSYAESSFKNTPLYRHIIKGKNSTTATLYENKPVASVEKPGTQLKTSDAKLEAGQSNNPVKPVNRTLPVRPVRNLSPRIRPANLMDPATFTPQMPFSEAINILRNSTIPKVNIAVLWKDLEENADIYPDTPIGIDGVSGVPLRRHLKSLLAGVSGASPEPLGYVVEDGVIVVATVESLPHKMVTRVYDITDLVGQPSTGFQQFGFGMPGMGMMGMGGMGGMGGMMGGMMPGMGMMGGYGGMGGMMGGMPGMGGFGNFGGGGFGNIGGGFGGVGGGYGSSLGYRR